MRGPSQQVTFRLAREYSDMLDDQAKEAGLSRGEFARVLVLSSLTSHNTSEDTRTRIAIIQDELQKMREELWTSVATLLIHAGKVDEESAHNWVRTTLMK